MIQTITVSSCSQILTLAMRDGRHLPISAVCLRRSAKDAWSRQARENHGGISVTPNIRIAAVVPMGNSGVRIEFSDGHNKAIYPFTYLQELAVQATCKPACAPNVDTAVA